MGFSGSKVLRWRLTFQHLREIFANIFCCCDLVLSGRVLKKFIKGWVADRSGFGGSEVLRGRLTFKKFRKVDRSGFGGSKVLRGKLTFKKFRKVVVDIFY